MNTNGSLSAGARGAADAPDEELVQVLDAYLAAVDAGRPPDPEHLIAGHPRIADRLRDCLGVFGLAERLTGDPDGDRPPDVDLRATQLGDFRLIRPIGRGGMGVVYEAEQISLRRRVALKVMPFAAALDPRQLQRFQLEAHAAACLHHTNIVPVHAVGTERGVPFYAMQFIEGRSLAEVIDDLRRLEGLVPEAGIAPDLAGISTTTLAAQLVTGPMEGRPASPSPGGATAVAPPCPVPTLPAGSTSARGEPTSVALQTSSTRTRDYIRNVSRLGLQAAEALDHAHTRGILHRDIKPANLMLGTDGHLWVTDFGLAQVQGNPGLTLTGDVLGTLRYMSPEQALARRVVIDGRTDVYSLGVTLYELLTLRPAFDGKDRAEILRRMAEQEPVPLRKHNPSVPVDLVTVIGKAMTKDPVGRYATASDLAEDLRRFLEERPIRARRPSLADRAAKWTRRHRSLVASAAVVLTLALVALSLSTILIAREQRLTAAALHSAEVRYDVARKAVDEMYTEVAEKWLAQQAQLEPLQRDFLLKASAFYQQFAREHSADPGTRHEAVHAELRAAAIQAKLGDNEAAERAYRRASEVSERLVMEYPEVREYRRDLAAALGNLADLLMKTGRFVEAEQATRRSIEIEETLVAETPQGPELVHVRRNLQVGFNNSFIVLDSIGRLVEAEHAIVRAVQLGELLVANSPNNADYRNELARSQGHLGGLMQKSDRMAEAERAYRRAIDLGEAPAKQLPRIFDYRHLLASNLFGFGILLHRTSRLEEAERAYRRAVDLGEALAAEAPRVLEYRSTLAQSHQHFGELLFETSQLTEAERAHRRSIELSEALAAEAPKVHSYRSSLASGQMSLGIILMQTGRRAEAEVAYGRAITLGTTLAAESPAQPEFRMRLARTLINSAVLLHEMGRVADAERQRRRVIALIEALVFDFPDVPEYQEGLAQGYNNLAAELAETGRLEEAERAIRRALEALEKLASSSPKVTEYRSLLGVTLRNLAGMLSDRGEREEAGKLVRKSVANLQFALNVEPNNPRYRRFFADSSYDLADDLLRQGDHAGAVRITEEALRVSSNRGQDASRAARIYALGLHRVATDSRLPTTDRELKAQAYADRTAALIKEGAAAAGNNPEVLNRFAWLLATCPESQLRDPARAVELARKAVDAAPETGEIWNTLGVAEYRAGAWNKAVESLTRSMELTAGGSPADWFFLSLAHWQRGEKDRARHWYDKAVAWMGSNQQKDAELEQFRTEAEALLGVKHRPIDKDNSPRPPSDLPGSHPLTETSSVARAGPVH